jgi:hypothetical protein
MGLYLIANGPMPTVAAQAPVTTGTAVKTLLQLKPFVTCKVVEWGVSFDGSAAATPIRCELLDTGTVFATVTASADADIPKFGSVEDAVASVGGLTLGTAATGYTATVEGSITAVRMFDTQFVAPSNGYLKQFPLGREPKLIIGNSARIRVTAGAAVNAYAYMILEF